MLNLHPFNRPLLIASMYGEGDGNKWGKSPFENGFDCVRVTDIIESPAQLRLDREKKWREVEDKISKYREWGRSWILDMSFVRNRLLAMGVDPYSTSAYDEWYWQLQKADGFCDKYRPVYVAVAGEIDYGVNTSKLEAFWAKVFGWWHQLSDVPISAGGLLHYDNDGEYKFAIPRSIELGADVGAVHVYSDKDVESLPLAASRCQALGAPFVVEEMGVKRTDPSRTETFKKYLQACLDADVQAIGLWGLEGDPNGEYSIIPSRDGEIIEMIQQIRSTGQLGVVSGGSVAPYWSTLTPSWDSLDLVGSPRYETVGDYVASPSGYTASYFTSKTAGTSVRAMGATIKFDNLEGHDRAWSSVTLVPWNDGPLSKTGLGQATPFHVSVARDAVTFYVRKEKNGSLEPVIKHKFSDIGSTDTDVAVAINGDTVVCVVGDETFVSTDHRYADALPGYYPCWETYITGADQDPRPLMKDPWVVHSSKNIVPSDWDSVLATIPRSSAAKAAVAKLP